MQRIPTFDESTAQMSRAGWRAAPAGGHAPRRPLFQQMTDPKNGATDRTPDFTLRIFGKTSFKGWL